MHEYPFLQCKCQMVVMKVHESHERLLRQLAVLGYKFIAFPRLFGRDKDGVICRLTYEDWADGKFCRKLILRDVIDVKTDVKIKEAA